MEEKINLLYNFLYNTSFNNCFDIDKITLGKITIDDIKVTNTKETDEILKELNKGKYSYINYDEKETIIYLKQYSDTYPITIKIGIYKKDTEELNNPSNNDALFSYLLSQIVINKKTNHILLPIVNFDIEFDKIEHLIKNIPIYTSIKEKVDFEEISKTFSVRIREHFFKSKLLKDYLDEHTCDYKPLLFQVIHTLAILQKEFPGFRHNNLTLNNILIYIKKENLSDNVYEYGTNKWVIPNIGFDIKIANFEKSTLPKYYGIINQRESEVPYITEINDYFDLHTFLNSLIEGTHKMSLKSNDSCDLETKKFLDKIIPENIRGIKDDNFYLKKNIIITKPSELLNDIYFKEYKNIKSSVENLSSNTYYTSMNKVKLDSDNVSVLGDQKEYHVRKLKEDTASYKNVRKLKGGAFFENQNVEKVEALKTNEEKKLETRTLIPFNPGAPRPPYNPGAPRPPYNPGAPRPPYQPRPDGARPPYNPGAPRAPYNPGAPRPSFPPKEELKAPEEKFETKQTLDEDFKEPEIPPGMIPLYDVNNTMISKIAPYPYNYVPQQVPTQKIYNISLSDPLGNHSLINRVYEDVLPGDPNTYTFLKLNERETIKKFMRNSILEKYDGEEMSIKGGDKTLLSWVKLFEVNPYTLKASPYENIPTGFLLYRSAYPIKYSKEDHTIKTTPTSMAFNLRVYKLSNGALRCKDIKGLDCNYYDIWRDIKYYEWVNTIIKRKISPNFINLILYVIDSKSKVGFDKLDLIKKQYNNEEYILQTDNNKNFLEKIGLSKININTNMPILNTNTLKRRLISENKYDLDKTTMNEAKEETLADSIKNQTLEIKNIINKIKPDTEKIDATTDYLLKDSGKILVAVTEAPNTNIIKWNSKVYKSYGTVKTMTSTGYHNPDVWRSVLFQLLYACAVLEKENIYFNNFSLENNVFIKDVQTDGTGNSCWVYKINNIEYYVPNYGYMVVIDSNFADITEKSTKQQFKIYSNIYGNINSDKSAFGSTFKTILKNKINCEEFKHFDANNLDDEVVKMITTILKELDATTNISNIFSNCFPEFFNNKIGKLLTILEKGSFNILNKPDYREGSLMIRQKRYDEYEWVIYLGQNGSQKKILIKDTKGYSQIDVFSSALFSYPEVVVPDDKTVIETFNFE